jgi:hypothetical protein
MQYVNLTVALAVQAALFTTILRTPPPSEPVRVTLGVAGALMTILFYINEHRIRAYWHAYFRRACEVEQKLEFRQYLCAPPRGRISSGNAIRALFIVLVIFWIGSSIFVDALK